MPRPKSNINPLSFVAGAFRSKEAKAKESEEAEKAYQEAREACEAAKRESCNAEAKAACEGHAGAFCAAVIRGRGKIRMGEDGQLEEEMSDEEVEIGGVELPKVSEKEKEKSKR